MALEFLEYADDIDIIYIDLRSLEECDLRSLEENGIKYLET